MRSVVVISLLSFVFLQGCVVALVGVGAGVGYAVMKNNKEAQELAQTTAQEEPPVHPVTKRIVEGETQVVPVYKKNPASPNASVQKNDDPTADVRYIYPEGYFKRGAAQ